jgi:hypothetical protein
MPELKKPVGPRHLLSGSEEAPALPMPASKLFREDAFLP